MARTQPSTTARGYGRDHQQLRAQWKPVVDAGQAWCAEVTCLHPTRWIQPGTPWHLAHSEGQHGYRGLPGVQEEECQQRQLRRDQQRVVDQLVAVVIEGVGRHEDHQVADQVQDEEGDERQARQGDQELGAN
jgi:hypothetical protein